MTSSDLLSRLAAAAGAVEAVPRAVAAYRELSDDTLNEALQSHARLIKIAESRGAILAGEVARRSAPALGHAGLAQRTGHRTAIELVRAVTGTTAREAATSVSAGLLIHEADPDPVTGAASGERPWLLPVASSLSAAAISPAAAQAISNGLGSPSHAVTTTELTIAAEQLCEEAAALDADRLFRRARELRDLLDESGIADREQQRRARRGLRFWRRPDGMGRLTWDLDPESSAIVGEIFDRVTSPKRGGPRFVDHDTQARADAVLADERAPEQYASDVFVQLLRQGADAEPSRLLGGTPPAVRVLVNMRSLNNRRGHGFLEGEHDPISIETVERIACSVGTVPIVFDDDGQGINVGREQRFFTRRQRLVMSARDGGCRWPGCDRPPSWTEAHHIEFWARDSGKTDIDKGILLCKHHHLLAHDHHWEIHHDQRSYWLIPPPTIDPAKRPIAMPSKSTVLRELVRT